MQDNPEEPLSLSVFKVKDMEKLFEPTLDSKAMINFEKLIHLRSKHSKPNRQLTIKSLRKFAKCLDVRDTYKQSLFSLAPNSIFDMLTKYDYEGMIDKAKNNMDQKLFRFVYAYANMKLHQNIEESLSITNQLIDDGYCHTELFALRASAFRLLGDIFSAELNVVFCLITTDCDEQLLSNYIRILITSFGDLATASYVCEFALAKFPNSLSLHLSLSTIKREQAMIRQNYYENTVDKDIKKTSLARIRLINKSCEQTWQLSRTHRHHIKKLLDFGSNKSLGVIGAGNCNHFYLSQLSNLYSHITLIDYDEMSLRYASKKVPPSDRQKFTLRGNIDITNILSKLHLWDQYFPDEDDLEKIFKIEHSRGWTEHFDILVVDGVIDNIFFCLDLKLSKESKHFKNLYSHILIKLFQTFFESTNDGGTIIIIDEQFSSLISKDLLVPNIAVKNQFNYNSEICDSHIITHLDHRIFADMILEQPALKERVHSIRLTEPWLWFYPGITFLASALIIKLK